MGAIGSKFRCSLAHGISERCIRRLMIGLMIVHSLMLGYGGWVHGPGWDEGGHLPAGIDYWQTGRTDQYRVNPPLVRAIATLPIAWLEFDMRPQAYVGSTVDRPEWEQGSKLWHSEGMKVYWYLTLCRWASIPWSLLAMWTIFRWASVLYGPGAGLFSATLWAFSPLVLGNAQMMTPDTGAAALGIAAMFEFWCWLRRPDWAGAYVAGLLLGLTQLAKFTWVFLFGLWPVLWLTHRFFIRRLSAPKSWRVELVQLAAIIGISLLIIHFGYFFSGTLTRLGDYPFVSNTLKSQTSFAQATGNRFSDTMFADLLVPLPRNYVLGIDRQKYDFEQDFPSYLRGQWRNHGWWYYYAYGLLIKEPLGYLLLFAATCVASLRMGMSRSEWFVLLPAAIIFSLVSSQTGFNHHLRYVLPCFPFVFVWMGKLWLWSAPGVFPGLRSGVAVLLGSSIVSSSIVFPHSHAYFNSLVGGPMHGQDHLLDSNIDWGQDILPLADWVKSHPEKPLDGVAYSLDWLIDREALNLPMARPPRGMDGSDFEREATLEQRSSFGPKPGRYAVFVRPLREDPGLKYFLAFEPVETLGYTVYIYELSQREVDDYWNRGEQKITAPKGSF